MAIRIVRLGSPRAKGEGLRIGTVRRPPRGVPKAEFAARDFYDVWLPNFAPSEELLKAGRRAQDERPWRSFAGRYRAEMSRPETSRVWDLLAALSHYPKDREASIFRRRCPEVSHSTNFTPWTISHLQTGRDGEARKIL